MYHYSTHELISGVLSQDDKVFKYLYQVSYKEVSWMVRRNSGTEDDAKDIFQEALIILYERISTGESELNCSPKTFLYAVCRNLWMKELVKRNRNCPLPVEDIDFLISEDCSALADEVTLLKIYFRHFRELSRECKKILHLHLKKVPIQEITRRLGFKSDTYTMDRKYRCKQNLIRKIEANPQYKEWNERQ